MRIASIETIPVALPFRERYVTSAGELDHREMLLLRLRSDEGLVGHGDAVPMSLRGGPGLDRVRADLEGTCRSVLVGAVIETDAIQPVLASCTAAGAGPEALSAVDVALLDLVGKRLDVPAWVVLGAPAAQPVRCNGTLGAEEPEAAGRMAEELATRGFGTIKVKVGTGADGPRMRAIRDACGEKVALRVDANGAWNADAAASALAELEPLGLELAEQPCATIEEMAELRPRVHVPLVADESAATRAEAERAISLGCDAVTLKLAKVGGPHAALRVASHAPAYLSSALDSALGIAAALHTAQALPARGFAARLAHGLATSSLFSDDVADSAGLGGPETPVPAGAGIGVDVDEEAIERLRIR